MVLVGMIGTVYGVVCIVDYGCMVCVLVFGALLLLADFVAYHDPAPILRRAKRPINKI